MFGSCPVKSGTVEISIIWTSIIRLLEFINSFLLFISSINSLYCFNLIVNIFKRVLIIQKSIVADPKTIKSDNVI